MYGIISQSLSAHRAKDLDKFLKSFVVSAVQAIVQSRLGEKISTRSRATTSPEWFTPTLKDVPELNIHARRFTSSYQPISGQTVCVEISLKTAEGDSMVLETWSMGLRDQCDTKEQFDREKQAPYVVYNKMSIALRSIIALSRVTPAYTLSRKQGADNYIICYKIYYGSPHLLELGEEFKTVKVGVVPSAIGTMVVSVAYRTNMQISQRKTSRSIPIEMKDDHFKQESSPRRSTTPRPCHPGHKRINTEADEITLAEVDSPGFGVAEFPCNLADDNQAATYMAMNGNLPKSQPIMICNQLNDHRNDHNLSGILDVKNDNIDGKIVGAFAHDLAYKDFKVEMDDIPFISLLQQSEQQQLQVMRNDDTADNGEKTEENILPPCSGELAHSASSETSNHDDFVMIDVVAPFAGSDTSSELWKCYRETQGVPSLSICKEECTLAETLHDITSQLQAFELNMKDFDDFINSLEEKE